MCNTNSIQKTIDKNINGENLSYSFIIKNFIYEIFLKINNT